FSSRRRHTRSDRDWSSDVCSSDLYNLLVNNKRHFTAQVPVLVQWDDHETRNNWYPGQTLGDERYTERSASLLAAYARRAMFEYRSEERRVGKEWRHRGRARG